MIGKGSTVSIGGDVIGKTTDDIIPPPFQRDMIDATHMGSTVKEYEAGFGGWGEFSFRTIAPIKNLTDTTNYYDSIAGEINSDTAVEVVIADPTTKVTWTFNAFITNWNVTIPTTDKIVTEVTGQPTGVVTFNEVV